MNNRLLQTDDFDYSLPDTLIAQKPVEPRDACRMLVLSRGSEEVEYCTFRDIVTQLKAGDRLVFNNTRVVPARVYTRKPTGGRCELFFLEAMADGVWKALVKPGSNAPVGAVLHGESAPEILFRIQAVLPSGERLVTIDTRSAPVTIEQAMEQHGHIPLPHYISRDDAATDRDDYQTVYAKVPGAVAAPTAGLHFTESLLSTLETAGVEHSFITLHVGIGTFRPVKTADPREHEMHEERYSISAAAVEEIAQTRRAGGRIIAVGTTVVRVLEHCYTTAGRLSPHDGATKIMIMPPYQFGCIDGLLTNFHLPRSTLLMLVCAFGGYEAVMEAYREAVAHSYRFYSYGDAMLLL